MLKQDVKFLKEFMEERQRDLEMRAVEERMSHEPGQVLRAEVLIERSERREERIAHEGFDLDDDEGYQEHSDGYAPFIGETWTQTTNKSTNRSLCGH